MDRRSPRDGVVPIVVVEDNRLLREGILAIVDREPDLHVVAVAEDADAAATLVSRVQPEVVLVDAGLGDHDSLDLVEHIVGVCPEARVIVMDILPDPEEVVEFVRRGASGLVVKDASLDVFLDTIRRVAGGQEVLPQDLTSTVFSYIVDRTTARASAGAGRSSRLTPREHQVIDLIAEGMSNKAIARELRISRHTVKSHVRNILEKLALHSRLQVAMYARDAGPSSEDE
ncbi:MAG TPA: response regulator transcription factor [Longimicrobiales bacterium]|nr:response regulator transcription factor [Longimicrobiales bacterium]